MKKLMFLMILLFFVLPMQAESGDINELLENPDGPQLDEPEDTDNSEKDSEE